MKIRILCNKWFWATLVLFQVKTGNIFWLRRYIPWEKNMGSEQFYLVCFWSTSLHKRYRLFHVFQSNRETYAFSDPTSKPDWVLPAPLWIVYSPSIQNVSRIPFAPRHINTICPMCSKGFAENRYAMLLLGPTSKFFHVKK